MFYQVKVACNGRNSLRFLWLPNGEVKQQSEIYRMTVHLFGATSSPSCITFGLHQAAADYSPEFEPYVMSAVEKNFYVDSCLLSVPTRIMGIKMVKDLSSLLSKAGFRLTKWISNNQEVFDMIPEEERSKCLTVGVFNDHTSERVLGVKWNTVVRRFSTSSLFEQFGFDQKIQAKNASKFEQNFGV